MKNIYIGKSNIHGWGLFTTNSLKEENIIGVSHVIYDRVWYQVFPLGIFFTDDNDVPSAPKYPPVVINNLPK